MAHVQCQQIALMLCSVHLCVYMVVPVKSSEITYCTVYAHTPGFGRF